MRFMHKSLVLLQKPSHKRDMELRQLEQYLAVADELSFSAAARRLHMSQPALSRSVKQLEEELGVTLLERSTARVRLTAAGDRLIDLANDLIDQSKELQGELRRIGEGKQQRLEIGYITPALDSFLQESLDMSQARFPDLTLNLHDLSPQAQTERLEKGELDVALLGSACPVLEQRFDLFQICEIPLRLALSSTHECARRRSLHLQECSEEVFISLKETSFPGRQALVEEACIQAGFSPRFGRQADSLHSLLALIGSGQGISLVPADMESLLPSRVKLLPLRSPECHITFMAAVTRDEARPTVRAFLQECRELAHSSMGRLR